jgi:hypothetical protein
MDKLAQIFNLSLQTGFVDKNIFIKANINLSYLSIKKWCVENESCRGVFQLFQIKNYRNNSNYLRYKQY